MVIVAQVFTLSHKSGEQSQEFGKKLLVVMGIMILIAVILLLVRDYLKDFMIHAFQDVTGIHNKKSLEKKLQQLKEKDDTLNVGIMIFDLNNLKQVNDNYGHEKGDTFIQSFASCLTRVINSNSFLARFGGDEFVIIQENTSLEELQKMDRKLHCLVEDYNLKTDLPISYAVGYDVSYQNHYFLIDDLMDDVDKKMYQDKAQKKAKKSIICTECPRMFAAIPTITPDLLVSKIYQMISLNPQKKYVVTMSDIENFHFINESYDFETGNEILDILSREFALFEYTVFSNRFHTDVFISLEDITNVTKEAFLEDVEKRNSKIVGLIKEKYPISYLQINTGARFILDEYTTPENIISFANIARRKARQYPNHICVYSNEIEREEKLHGEILHSFQKAIFNNEFLIYFQPKVDTRTLMIKSAEVLVRWEKEDGEIWSPDKFLPLLEKTGFIVELDFYVYEKAFQWMKEREVLGKSQIPISLNVSPVHLNDSERFMKTVFKMLEKYQINTSTIIFEITESMFIQQPELVNDIIKKSHEKGIRISMDDFGSGYSSLNTLKNILFDEVKIDKQFVEKELSENGKIVLQELFHMLRRLDKYIVCEGVETREIADFLIEEKCDEMQGYLFYKPMALEQFQKELKE